MFTRKIVFHPAFDKRSQDPKNNYGIHGAEIQFQLIGPEGGITYTIFTNWHLPHVQEETDRKELSSESYLRYMFHKPQTAGLDGHWKTPQYSEKEPHLSCLITGGQCYSDGTSITKDVFDLLIAEGDEALWKLLEQRYNDWKPKDES